MPPESPLWNQFRRLVLGTVIEGLLEHHVPLDFRSIAIDFDDDSTFKVPRLNNYMRFSGSLRAGLTDEVEPATLRALEHELRQAWPALCQVIDLPLGDRLTNEGNEIRVGLVDDGAALLIEFDLVAD